MIWPFTRKPETRVSDRPEARQLEELAKLVRHLGYDLQPDGASVGLAALMSDYSVAEAASHTVVVSFANDVLRPAESGNLDMTMKLAPLGMAILEVLKELKDKGLMRPEIWSNDATAIGKMMTPGPAAIEWANRVLSDPMVSGKVLARSRIL